MKISRLKSWRIFPKIGKICSSKETKVLLIIFFLTIHFSLGIMILNDIDDANIRLVNIQHEKTTEFMIELKQIEFAEKTYHSSLLKEIFVIKTDIEEIKKIASSTNFEINWIENRLNSIEKKIKDNYLYK